MGFTPEAQIKKNNVLFGNYFKSAYFNARIQGDSNQKLLIQMAITLKICISDLKLVKPKCVLGAYIYFDFSAVCLQFSAGCLKTKSNVLLSNAFWLYKHGVKNA